MKGRAEYYADLELAYEEIFRDNPVVRVIVDDDPDGSWNPRIRLRLAKGNTILVSRDAEGNGPGWLHEEDDD